MVTATPDSPNPPPAKTGGWVRWRGPVLFVSLGLNLFLVGIMAGGWWHHYQGRHWREHAVARHVGQMGGPGMPGPAGMAVMREAIQRLPEADRKPFEETMSARRAEMQQMQQELRQARMKVNNAIRAEPFDAKAMADALAAVRAKLQEMQSKIHAGFVEAVGKLPADKRRHFAESIAEIRTRR